MKKVLMFAILGVFLISFASAGLSSKISEDYDLKIYCQNHGYCSVDAICNITVENPLNSIIIDNVQLNNNINYHNYTISNLSLSNLGIYQVTGFCNDGLYTKDFNFPFEITLDGNPSTHGNERILFLILFLIIVGGMVGLMMYTIFKMIAWDFNANDLIYNISVYFVLFVTYILSKSYLNDIFVDEFLVWLIGIGALTTVVLPFIAFFMNIVKGNLKQNE